MSTFAKRFTRRVSGLDFHDRSPPNPEPHASDIHPDIPRTNPAFAPSHLTRNKTERRRLQGLMRGTTLKSSSTSLNSSETKGSGMTFGIGGSGKFGGGGGERKFMEKAKIWMINEGGRRIFFFTFVFVHILVAVFGFLNYQLKDNLTTARATFGITYPIARAAALVLHLDAAFILLPVCRNFISLVRRTPLNTFIPFDKNITFHKAVAWSILTFTVIHTGAHMVNFALLAKADTAAKSGGEKFLAFLAANFTTGPGITGWIMNACLFTMVFFAMEKRRRAKFERFWYSHHLFIPFFICWQLHGMFCMIKPDREPFCSWLQIGVFWRYWLVGGVIFIYERILREIRSRHRTFVSKVIQHPSKVVEVQIKKDKTTTRAGQYIFINCPDVSYFQWHPFTLTSAPEEDYISVHIRVVGDFTAAFAKALGCDFGDSKSKDSKDGKKEGDGSKVVGAVQNAGYNNPILPRVMVDGPFGSASEDFLNYETVLLVGAGIGVTPFASILKSIWYRLNSSSSSGRDHHSSGKGVSKRTRLSKVYFTWVIRDFGTAEWFHSLLHAIEEQDLSNRIEINIYLTAKIKEDDMNNIIVSDVGAEKDAITSLRAPTHFGRPNWDVIFPSIADKHPSTDVGVFFCGPAVLSKTLHEKCNRYSEPKGTRFFFGKENF